MRPISQINSFPSRGDSCEDLAVFSRFPVAVRRLKITQNFSKFDFFQDPSVGPGMGLEDHVVAIR